MPDLLVPRRFCGPPSSGNGGYTAGALGTRVDAATVSVSLLAPPPLDTPMGVDVSGGKTVASVDGRPIARAETGDLDGPTVDSVPVDEARAAEASYAGLTAHPFPTCFVCGTGRDDGLRIFPGPVADQDGRPRVAGTWTPDETVADDLLAVTWSALDCTGGWAGGLAERTMVLARMTARVDALPRVGDEHVVVGLGRRTEGRKTFTAAALHDASGRLLGRAEHLWIAVDPAAFA
ncbi:hypothetical protein [Nocardioides sp. URHA0020]|uniref:hypothetical protein n=1 Tax=Nocardioides sp. URHA0020 TaxID=1380392 RepID=UPI00048B9F7E|nr:hypothetical protein [Nocardioides sp. URHA0020]